MQIAEKIRGLLVGTNYQLIEHAPAATSEEAAQIRGTSLHQGAKALLMKGDTGFFLVVTAADVRMDSKKVKDLLHTKSLRFATQEELLEITGCEPGACPPFGSIFGLATYVSSSLLDNEDIAFNCGSKTMSMIIPLSAYLTAEKVAVIEG